jgi:hypothetical protein
MNNKIYLLIVILALALSAFVCNAQQATARMNPAVHIQVVAPVQNGKSSAGAIDECFDWSGISGKCDTDVQSVYPGTIQNPATVPISTWTAGQIQLNDAKVSLSWGLNWTDQKGNPVDPKNLIEGVFYTFKVNSDQIHGFDLVHK